MLGRRDSGVGRSGGRRIRRSLLLFRIGMISMTRHDRTTMRSTRTAMRGSERSESGRIDYTPIDRRGKLRVTRTAAMRKTIAQG
jgi:hypothetical protein